MRMIRYAMFLPMLMLSALAWAEPIKYTVDKWHTRIYFTVSHMGLSNFSGRFLEYDIEFMFDDENLANSSVEVSVPVASIDTFSPELNSKKIDQVDAAHAKMHGDLTIKGTTLPVTFDVTFNAQVMHPFYAKNNAGFTATATIDSRAYDVNQLPDWMVGDDVEIRIEMEAFEGDSVPYYSELK